MAGTDLNVKVTALCPGNHKITSTLYDEKTTNSLFADSSSEEDGEITAVIAYGRHLQNLDLGSGVTEKVTAARQAANITLTDNDKQVETKDWYETYSEGYYNGLVEVDGQESRPNFEPIVNPNLLSYDGKPDEIGGTENTTQFRIINLTEDVAADKSGASEAGLFGELSSGQTVKNVILTGARITAEGKNGVAGTLVGKVACGSDDEAVTIENCQSYLTTSDINGKSNQDIYVKAAHSAGGLIGSIKEGQVTIADSSASTVVGDAAFDSESGEVTKYGTQNAGGLVGQTTSKAVLEIKNSYADNYLVGEYAGGLVGANTGSVSLSSVYTAGFATFETGGAGLVFGPADLENAYTVISKLHVDDVPYYSTVQSGTGSGKIYYAVHSTDQTRDLGEEINGYSISDLAAALGDSFKTDTSLSAPYNLMGQSLLKYIYPVLKNVTHYGDWDASFEEGTLVYYEVYSDGTYGFYGANVESTLKDDASLTVVGDGYGLVYLTGGDNLPNSLKITMSDGDTVIKEETLAIKSGSYHSVVGKDGRSYMIYPLSTEMVNTTHASSDFYLKLKVEPDTGTNADFYYFNPHFAKTVVPLMDDSGEVPAFTEDSTISVRTARHIYMMSLYYDTYAAKTEPCTYSQERNIDYATYGWRSYSLRSDDTTSQSPISGNGSVDSATAFISTYDGQCHWITNVSFTTDDGSYVGFIGRNQGTIKNVVLRATYTSGGSNNYYVGRSGDVLTNQSVYIGVLAGSNEQVEGRDGSGRITNCAVSGYYLSGSDATIHAYKNSYLYAGGLTG